MKHIHEEDVVRRLRSLGEHPVEPGVAERHASYLAAAAPVVTHSRRRPAITAALMAGALLGGTGLAAALPGPLPTQASSVAKSALEAVNLAEEEKDPAKEAAKTAKAEARAAAKAANGHGVARFLTGCTVGTPPTAFVGNHGQYVKAHPDDPATADVNEREVAAESNCGKPAKAVANKAAGGAEDDEKGKPEDAGAPDDKGRPESPGKSEESHPPATAEKEQGSENRNTERGKSGEAGKADDHRPEGVGPSTTSSTTTSSTSTTSSTTTTTTG